MQTCDPHSNYFDNGSKAVFENSLSKDILSFGFTVGKNEFDEFFIDDITPGSSTYYNSNIKKGDILLSIAWNDQEIDYLPCASDDDVNFSLSTSEASNIKISIKNELGIVSDITVTKEKIHNDENFLAAFVLEGEKKVGYVALPSFYYNSNTSLGVASDLAKEIVQFKTQKIEGLILDLRNNSGGSLKEAVDIAGMFIDQGPLVFDTSVYYPKPLVVKDLNRGYVFNKPVVLLVNGNSASASEILAIILKAYNKAVIVGGNTFGKATGQNTFPFNSGGVKLTNSQFTALDGTTYQKHGVIPDIPIPDIFSLFYEYEHDEAFALPPVSLSKKNEIKKEKEIPIELLLRNSKDRVKSDSIFQKIVSKEKEIKLFLDEERIMPLNLADFKEYRKKFVNLFNKDYVVKNDEYFKLLPNSNMRLMMEFDDGIKLNVENQTRSIYSDPQIKETLNILIDYLKNIN